jgi:hypothetical protein
MFGLGTKRAYTVSFLCVSCCRANEGETPIMAASSEDAMRHALRSRRCSFCNARMDKEAPVNVRAIDGSDSLAA